MRTDAKNVMYVVGKKSNYYKRSAQVGIYLIIT